MFGFDRKPLTPDLTIPAFSETAEAAASAAEEILGQMEELYRMYQLEIEQYLASLSVGNRIGDWLCGKDSADPLNIRFYQAVKEHIGNLCGHLQVLGVENKAARALSARAMGILIHPIPDEERNDANMMVLAAELLCEPLLPYLDKTDLARYRAEYVKAYPKRNQLPNQKKLVARMDALLK